jgi:hypothetical protein
MLAEKAGSQGRPRKSFEETFRTSFAFLSNPRILRYFGVPEHRRKRVKLLFGGRVRYAVSDGLRTPQTASVFAALEGISNDDLTFPRQGLHFVPDT